LILLFPFALIGQKVLKAGTYQSLKPTEPIVLDTGNFVFIGLEMSGMDASLVVRDPWFYASKADNIRFVNCGFTQIWVWCGPET